MTAKKKKDFWEKNLAILLVSLKLLHRVDIKTDSNAIWRLKNWKNVKKTIKAKRDFFCFVKVPTSAVGWHLQKILGISKIAILENFEIFLLTIWVLFCRKIQKKYDGVHYIISSALCRSELEDLKTKTEMNMTANNPSTQTHAGAIPWKLEARILEEKKTQRWKSWSAD